MAELMAKTKIEWVQNLDGSKGEVWNPISGCSKISDGCRNCYAERIHKRGFIKSMPPFKPWTKNNSLTNVTIHEDRFARPLLWKKPRMVFVNSMSDLFHEMVSNEVIAKIFATMARAKTQTFQVLTKRPERMQELLSNSTFNDSVGGLIAVQLPKKSPTHWYHDPHKFQWPLPNVWMGVSAEDQKTFDERVRLLLQTPAAVRWVSLEPLLGAIILDDVGGGGHTALTTEIDHPEDTRLDWVVVGGESGPGARPMHPDWVRSIRDQCELADVAFFLKQRGEFVPMQEAKARGLRWTQRVCKMASGAYYPEWMCRVGKKNAGHELDGKVWHQFPVEMPRGK